MRNRLPFSAVGSIAIIISDQPDASATLAWDDRGQLIVSTRSELALEGALPTFEAPKSVWSQFVAGEASAARLVVRGKVRFSGSPLFLLAHGAKFDLLGQVCADMLKAAASAA